MEKHKIVYDGCLKLFMELQNSDDKEKLKIYNEMLKLIKFNFNEVNNRYNKRKIKKILNNYYEVELYDLDDYGTISWHYLLCYIGDIYCVGNNVILAGTNGRYSYEDDYMYPVTELYATIIFLKKKLELGCTDNESLATLKK